MALDVFLQENPEHPIQGIEYEEIVDFEDDEGYDCFLYTLFQH